MRGVPCLRGAQCECASRAPVALRRCPPPHSSSPRRRTRRRSLGLARPAPPAPTLQVCPSTTSLAPPKADPSLWAPICSVPRSRRPASARPDRRDSSHLSPARTPPHHRPTPRPLPPSACRSRACSYHNPRLSTPVQCRASHRPSRLALPCRHSPSPWATARRFPALLGTACQGCQVGRCPPRSPRTPASFSPWAMRVCGFSLEMFVPGGRACTACTYGNMNQQSVPELGGSPEWTPDAFPCGSTAPTRWILSSVCQHTATCSAPVRPL